MSVRRWPVVLAVPLLVAGCSYFGPRQPEDWRTRTDADSATLAVDEALRDIDPCGFVDAESIKAKIPRAISYGYTEGFDRCTLRLGAFDGDFPSDVSATIGFDFGPAPSETSEPPPSIPWRSTGSLSVACWGPRAIADGAVMSSISV